MALHIIKNRMARITSLAVLAIGIGIFGFGHPASAATGVMDDTAYQIVKPSTNSSLLTTTTTEVTSAATSCGYTASDSAFLVSKETGTGLKPVKRYYNSSKGDFTSELDTTKQQTLVSAGYVDQGVRFYASAIDTAQTEPVFRYTKGTKHQYALSKSDQAALSSAGWLSEGVSFYAIPTAADAHEFVVTPTPTPVPTPPTDYTDGVFDIAVMPDTQIEAESFSGNQYNNRMQFIVGQKASRDIRFIAHTGDLINGGANETQAPDPGQVAMAENAFNIIDTSGIPYLTSLGNHDTAAVCLNGSACPNTVGSSFSLNSLFRNTSVLNRYFSVAREKVDGSYDGKIENSYKTFSAEGKDWLVLNIEMTPRQVALDWAKNVVSTHPKYNVIVLSHYLLEEDGSIVSGMGNAGYGNLSPSQIYSQLILAYPNVKMAFCGHRGYSANYRVDTGVNGNKVPTFIATFHSDNFNPTRFVSIDVTNGTITSDIKAASIRPAYLAAYPNTTLPSYDEYAVTVSGMNFINR